MTDDQEARHRALSDRVNLLSVDVERFRSELCRVADRAEQADRRLADEMAEALVKVHDKLDQTISMQASRHADQAAQIHRIQTSIDGLADDLKEPMEVYRTAKYGAKATTLLVAFVKWAVPVCVGLLIGYNALQAKMLAEVRGAEPATKQRAESE